MQPPAATAPPVPGSTERDERRALVPAPRTGPGTTAPAPDPTEPPSPAPAGSTPVATGAARPLPALVRRRRLVGTLVVGPPTAVLGAVLGASALDVSAPASMLLTGTPTGPAGLLARAAAVGLLAVAALAVHDLLLRRGLHPAATAGVVVLGAAPLGGLALVEPGPAAAVAGVVVLLRAAAPRLRRGGTPLAAPLALVVLLVASAAAVRRGVGDRSTPLPDASARGTVPDLVDGPGAAVIRAVADVGAAGVVAAALPLLVLAAVLTRGRTRLLLSLLAGAVGLVAAVVGAAG